MINVPCRECKKEVLLFSAECPHCGLPKAYLVEEESLMFKLTPFLSLMGLIGLIVMIFWPVFGMVF